MKRDCVFLLADKNMKGAFEGFFSRENFHLSLNCGPFDFDVVKDIAVASGDNDPGLYTQGHELLRPFQVTHHRALVVLDAEWDGSPGAERIKADLSGKIKSTGWGSETFRVIVIDPELENWIWQKNDHVAKGLGCPSCQEMMGDATVQAGWPEAEAKPPRPKELLEDILRRRRIPRSSAIYKNITSRVSVKGCTDSAFEELLAALREWFPAEGQRG